MIHHNSRPMEGDDQPVTEEGVDKSATEELATEAPTPGVSELTLKISKRAENVAARESHSLERRTRSRKWRSM